MCSSNVPVYVLVLLFTVYCIEVRSKTTVTNPGFKARITAHGFKYANDVAINVLTKKIQGLALPDQHGDASHVHYDLTQMRITSFGKPGSSISLNEGSGLTWTASGASLSVHGNFHYKYKKGWFKISDGGSFDVTISGLAFSLSMQFGKDGGGRPSISAGQCSCSIGKVSVKFHGGAAWIYNLFRSMVEKMVKKTLEGKMCDIIKDSVNKDAEQSLQKLPVKVAIGKYMMLDYSLFDSPSFTTTYMETRHKGEIFWKGNNTDAPFSPAALPGTTDSSKMLYLWVSDYLFNTLVYVAHHHGLLQYNLTAADLPPESRGVLNTTCSGVTPCISKLIPQIGQKYPNTTVILRMRTDCVPNVTIGNGMLQIQASGEIEMFAKVKDGLANMAVLSANASAKVNLTLRQQKIFGSIADSKVTLTVKKSYVGNINEQALNLLTNVAIRGFVVPKLNELGKDGFPLPLTGKVQLRNTHLEFAQHTLIISTDVLYQEQADEGGIAIVTYSHETLPGSPNGSPMRIQKPTNVRHVSPKLRQPYKMLQSSKQWSSNVVNMAMAEMDDIRK